MKRPALLCLLVATAGAGWWATRPRLLQVRLEGSIRPGSSRLPLAHRLRVEAWFPELRLGVDSWGRPVWRDENAVEHVRLDPDQPSQLRVLPDGRVEALYTLRARRKPTFCCLSFHEPGHVTRYLRHVPLSGEGLLHGSFRDAEQRPRRS